MFPKRIQKFSYAKMTRNEWLQLRSKVGGRGATDDYVRFGGSDIGTIMGLDEWTSKGAFFYELIGVKERKDSMNPHAFRGIQTEDIIYRGWWRYFDPQHPDIKTLINNWTNDNIVRRAQRASYTLIHPDYDHLFSNVDRVIPRQLGNKKRILEIKNMLWSALEKWENDLPPYYITQVQSYMLVSEFEESEVFVLKDTTYPLCFPIPANDYIQKVILEEVNEFAASVLECRALLAEETDPDKMWNIVYRLEPAPDGGDKYVKFMKEIRRPENAKAELDMPEELVTLVTNFSEIKESMNNDEDKLIDLEGEIRNYFNKQNAVKFTHNGVSISWKTRLNIPKKFHEKIKINE